jgi:hypothetical protein
MSKFLFSIPLIALMFNQISYGLSVTLPRENFYDVNIPRTQVGNNESHVLSAISFVNSYLWFFIGFICFFFLVWNGIKLVMARGEKDAMKKATTGLLGSAVGIVICFVSYAVVRIIVNLF